jgi:hypothetical protein
MALLESELNLFFKKKTSIGDDHRSCTSAENLALAVSGGV